MNARLVLLIAAFISFAEGSNSKCVIQPKPPAKISQTCFAGLKDFFEYEPQYPSYSDGASKRRWVYLPRGLKIQTKDLDNWIFPKGTVVFKEFSIGTTKIETRVLEKTTDQSGPDAWRFTNYAWTGDQKDAELVTSSFYDKKDLSRFSAATIQNQFKIVMPNDCVRCHAGVRDVVNGFNYLQLSSDSIGFNVFRAGDVGMLSSAPKIFDKIQGSDLDRRAIGYIQSNCAICHAANGPGVGNFTHSYLVTSRDSENLILSGLVVKGSPDQSFLYKMFSSGRMPQFSPVNQDTEGVSLIRDWIIGLEPRSLGIQKSN